MDRTPGVVRGGPGRAAHLHGWQRRSWLVVRLGCSAGGHLALCFCCPGACRRSIPAPERPSGYAPGTHPATQRAVPLSQRLRHSFWSCSRIALCLIARSARCDVRWLPPSSSDLAERKSVVPPSPPADRRHEPRESSAVVVARRGKTPPLASPPCGGARLPTLAARNTGITR